MSADVCVFCQTISVTFSQGYIHIYRKTSSRLSQRHPSGFLQHIFPQKTSLLMVLNPPPPPPPPDGPQLPGGLLSSEPLGLNEQEDDGACRAWVRALSSCSYGHRGGQRRARQIRTETQQVCPRVHLASMQYNWSVSLNIITSPSSGGDLLHSLKQAHQKVIFTHYSSMTREITPCVLQDSSDFASSSHTLTHKKEEKAIRVSISCKSIVVFHSASLHRRGSFRPLIMVFVVMLCITRRKT